MSEYRILAPETRDGATIWHTYNCSWCQRLIYQLCEPVWTTGEWRFYHELCKLQLEAKLKKEKA